jgi:hypothetical protein
MIAKENAVVDFMNQSFVIPLMFAIIHPLIWGLLMTLVLVMRRNFVMNKYLQNNDAIPENIAKLEFKDIYKHCFRASATILVLSIFGLCYYKVALEVIVPTLAERGPGPVRAIAIIINMLRRMFEFLVTTNGARIIFILTLPIIMFPIILGVTWSSFTTICAITKLDDSKYDVNPFVTQNFKDQILLGLRKPNIKS